MEKRGLFTRFGELPTEIRLKIWELAAREPRNIHIKYQKGSYPFGTGQRFYAKSYTPTTPPPAVLHACHESRYETLHEYELRFATLHAPAMVYIAFERDTIRFTSNALAYLGPADRQSIHSMSLEVTDYPYFAHFNMGILARAMPNLKFLELRAVQGKESAWSLGILRTLMEDFDEERESFPEGRLPSIRIVSEDTGEELAATKDDGGWTGGFALHMENQALRRETSSPVASTDV